MKRVAELLSVVGLLAGISLDRAHAALLAYEGFDYTNNTTIAGQAGGSLWTNAWASGTSQGLATNVAGSLGYTDVNGRSLQTSGGSLVVGNPGGSTATTANPNRAINGNLSGGTNTAAGPGRTNWISFLYKRLNFIPGPYFRQANLGLFEGGTERADVGAPNTGATVTHHLSVWGSGAHNQAAPFQATDFPITSGATYFILMKTVTDGGTNVDAAYFWFNWTNLLVEPSISTATLTNNEVNLSPVTNLRFQCGNANASGSNAVMQVDELRVGTTFDDVTPSFVSGSAPFINSPPADQTVTIGDPASFSVNAAGSPPLFYQWYFNTNTSLLRPQAMSKFFSSGVNVKCQQRSPIGTVFSSTKVLPLNTCSSLALKAATNSRLPLLSNAMPYGPFAVATVFSGLNFLSSNKILSPYSSDTT